jgi:hypothetical protein
MKSILDKFDKCTRIDKQTTLCLYKMSSKILISLVEEDKIKISPDFQRNLNHSKVEEIKLAASKLNTWYQTHGDFILGVIFKDTNGNGDYYLLDGQHRLKSLISIKSDIDIYVKLISFDSIANMKHYFKSINQNSNLETEYSISDSDYCDDIRTYLKKQFDRYYPKAFSCRTTTRGNRDNIDEHVRLFDNEIIKSIYKNIEFDNGSYLWNQIKSINNEAEIDFAKFQRDKNLHKYLKQSDETSIISNDYYLCLKNVEFLDHIMNSNKPIEYVPLLKLKKTRPNVINPNSVI